MKINKRTAAMLLAVMAVLLLLPVQAFAAGSIDLNRDCNLTISYQDNGVSLVGAEFSIYRVADVDEGGELTATEAYSEFNVNIRGKNDSAWKTLASTLEGYVLRDSMAAADKGTTDSQGKLSFPTGEKKLLPGLYLILGSRHTQNGRIYDAQPSMVLLPALDKEANEWNYKTEVNPKFESRPEPKDETVTRKVLKVWKDKGHEKNRPEKIQVQLLRDGKVFDTVTLKEENNWRHTWKDLDDAYRWTVVENKQEGYTVEISREGVTYVVTNTYAGKEPGKPTPGKPTLPQTGQLWWPVPLLAAAGMLLLVLGLLRRRGASDEKK